MSVPQSPWASVQGDPVFMRKVNGWLTVFWLAMIPVSVVTHWINSVTCVAALSLWALVSGRWSAWQAARVEVNQEVEADQRNKADVPGERSSTGWCTTPTCRLPQALVVSKGATDD